MNKKGTDSIVGVGVFMGIFVAVIVGIALFQASAQNIGEATNTIVFENESITGAAVDATPQIITGIQSLTDVIVFNATNDVTVEADNYTITNNVVTDGALTVTITPDNPAPELGYDVGTWTIDGTAQPVGYINDSGGRAIAIMIIIFMGLAIAVVALIPTLRSEVLKMVGK